MNKLRSVVAAGIFAIGICPVKAETSMRELAHRAYTDLISAFWIGSAAEGMWRTNPEDPRGTRQLWEIAQATNAIYGYWRSTGSADAAVRLSSVWYWAKRSFGTRGLTTCGSGSAANFGSDDAAWNIGLMLEAYGVTGDRDALVDARAALDCAWLRWHDNICGGGIWYNDKREEKSLYAAPYAFENYWYFQISGDRLYRSRAIDLDAWMAKELQRFPGTFGSIGDRFIDGLYWVTMNHDCFIDGRTTPYNIQERASITMLAGNMAEAALAARLYRDPMISTSAKALYLRRIIMGSQGIKLYEEGGGSRGAGVGWVCEPPLRYAHVFLDDRDGFVDGWAAVFFVRDVLPLLVGQPGVVTKEDFIHTAEVIYYKARNHDGTYSASWSGDNCWTANGRTLPQRLNVSGQTVNLLLSITALP